MLAITTANNLSAQVQAALAAYGVEAWTSVQGSITYPVGGIPTNPGVIFYTPTANIEVIKDLVIQFSAADPLVIPAGNSLAAGILISGGGGGVATLSAILAKGNWNSNLQIGPSATLPGPTGNTVLAKANALFAGSALRALRVWVDAGAGSGTLVYSFRRSVILP